MNVEIKEGLKDVKYLLKPYVEDKNIKRMKKYSNGKVIKSFKRYNVSRKELGRGMCVVGRLEIAHKDKVMISKDNIIIPIQDKIINPLSTF